MINSKFWKNKKVLITGHTGFKGGWLSLILNELGSNVTGISLPPIYDNSLFDLFDLKSKIASHFIDIRDKEDVNKLFKKNKFDIVFHLAAQPIVLESYVNPYETYSTNVMGTVNVLDAFKDHSKAKVAIFITSDKCYQNNEWIWPYRESDRLGGDDPYSNSKACTELVCHAYNESFIKLKNSEKVLSTARAGNVIGGGDWAENRLIPDYIRALMSKKTITLRNPNAIRPWQHVYEPLFGYLALAEKTFTNKKYSGAYNFGPDADAQLSVKKVINQINKISKIKIKIKYKENRFKEANLLTLDSSKASQILNWKNFYSYEDAIRETIEWYQIFIDKGDIYKYSIESIQNYLKKLSKK